MFGAAAVTQGLRLLLHGRSLARPLPGQPAVGRACALGLARGQLCEACATSRCAACAHGSPVCLLLLPLPGRQGPVGASAGDGWVSNLRSRLLAAHCLVYGCIGARCAAALWRSLPLISANAAAVSAHGCQLCSKSSPLPLNAAIFGSKFCCLSFSACRRIRGLGMEVCTTLGMLTPEQVCESHQMQSLVRLSRPLMLVIFGSPAAPVEAQLRPVPLCGSRVPPLKPAAYATTAPGPAPVQAAQLRQAGLTAYNHNLDTSPGGWRVGFDCTFTACGKCCCPRLSQHAASAVARGFHSMLPGGSHKSAWCAGQRTYHHGPTCTVAPSTNRCIYPAACASNPSNRRVLRPGVHHPHLRRPPGHAGGCAPGRHLGLCGRHHWAGRRPDGPSGPAAPGVEAAGCWC